MHICYGSIYIYIYIYIFKYIHVCSPRPQDLHFSGFREPRRQTETIRLKSEPQRGRGRERKREKARERESKHARFSITYCIVAVLPLENL